MKILSKNSCVFENKHFSFSFIYHYFWTRTFSIAGRPGQTTVSLQTPAVSSTSSTMWTKGRTSCPSLAGGPSWCIVRLASAGREPSSYSTWSSDRYPDKVCGDFLVTFFFLLLLLLLLFFFEGLYFQENFIWKTSNKLVTCAPIFFTVLIVSNVFHTWAFGHTLSEW